ncbi:MerR family transcriptional regulator [Nocardia vaccinii]|uniref:MerR family transcriptional regulator n=1 Tax=Nocardia vaccinii TaxID=1822 RepID=UPI0008330FEB|nr:MerR family transcriptional regulator [Nocardia vaccinii]
MITIGQLARYAGVTIKAVRVYHERGLLPEPARDSSGYRRYRAEDAIELVKIKTLAHAGVPLARVKQLLTANSDEFAAAIAEIDRALADRAEEIRRTREQIAELGSGDRLFVSTDVADYLDRLQQLGGSDRAVRMERDLWILMQSVAPDQASAWIADKLDAIDDPQFRAIYLDYDAAFDWSPDDPRLMDLADRTRRWQTARHTGADRTTPALDPKLTRLVSESVGITSPAWERLAEIAQKGVAVVSAEFRADMA